jgi:hypothetical protein
MDPKSIFFQTNFDGEPAPIELTGFRGRVTAPCPGRADNTVSLCLGEGCNKFKLSRPKNVGSCEAYVLFYDQSGTFIGGRILQPGDELESISPKSNTYNVRFGCSPRCGGSATLEFDVTEFV